MVSDITIGKYRFKNRVNAVQIESSRENLSDTAVIKLPNLTGTLEKKIEYGDVVEIKLGYDEELVTEFKGFVKAIKPGVPVEIHCEDEMYQLKKKSITPESWGTIKLEQVIKYIYSGAITKVYDTSLSPFRIDKSCKNKARALEVLKHEYGLDIYFNEKGQLYAGLPYQERTETVIYHFQKNINQESTNLEFRRKEDLTILIKAISINGNNEKTEANPVGDAGGEEHTLHYYNKTKEELEELAKEKLKSLKYDGYRGQFYAKGKPYVRHSMIADIRDDRHPERAGKYFIDSVKIDYNETDGYKKTIELGRKHE